MTTPELARYQQRYATHAGTALRLTLVLQSGSQLAGYDELNLDNLLARCVVDEATAGRGLATQDDAYDLPVPLTCLWRDPDGFPLWAATAFRPGGVTHGDITTWHKRVQAGRFSATKTGRLNLTGTGRYAEKRVPLPTVVAQRWEATAQGEPEEIARLLASVSHVGKKRAQGFGAVDHWELESLDGFALVQDGRLTRALPAAAAALLGGVSPLGEPALLGWTPPQWKASLFAPGWRAGTPVT